MNKRALPQPKYSSKKRNSKDYYTKHPVKYEAAGFSNIDNMRFEKRSDTAIFVHSSHIDLWDEIFEALDNAGDYDLYVSVPFEMGARHREVILSRKPDARIIEFDRRGRDVAPFLEVYRRIHSLGYQYLCKIHTKKSTYRADGHLWRKDLLAKLLGSSERVKHAKQMLSSGYGMVVPEGHLFPIHSNRHKNWPKVQLLARQMKTSTTAKDLVFPVGLMFWCKPKALQPLLRLKITWRDFEREPCPTDGTLAHAFERAISVAVKLSGHHIGEMLLKSNRIMLNIKVNEKKQISIPLQTKRNNISLSDAVAATTHYDMCHHGVTGKCTSGLIRTPSVKSHSCLNMLCGDVLIINDFMQPPEIQIVTNRTGKNVVLAKGTIPNGHFALEWLDKKRAIYDFQIRILCHDRGTIVFRNIKYSRNPLIYQLDSINPEKPAKVTESGEATLTLQSRSWRNFEKLRIAVHAGNENVKKTRLFYGTDLDTTLRPIGHRFSRVNDGLLLTQFELGGRHLKVIKINLSGQNIANSIPLKHVHVYGLANTKKSGPMVSFIVPCYNSGKYLRETINSILATPNKRQYEVIVVNDGSTDHTTLNALEEIRQERILVIDQDNKGVAAARNTAIRHARGKYILPVDADNLIDPSFMSRAVQAFETDNNVGVVHGYAKFFGDQAQIDFLLKNNSGKADNVHVTDNFSPRNHFFLNKIDTCAFFRKEVWEEVGGYDTTMIGYQDWEFWAGIAELKKFKFYNTKTVTFHYRVRKDSMVSNSFKHHEALKSYIASKHIALYKEEYEIMLKGCSRQLNRPFNSGNILNPDDKMFMAAYVKVFWRNLKHERKLHRVAVFGAGKHSSWLANIVKKSDGPQVVAILDDMPDLNNKFFGLIPRLTSRFKTNKVDAIILSSDCMQKKMRERCRKLYSDNVPLIDLYEGLPPGPYAKT